jgi:hypothetical protein
VVLKLPKYREEVLFFSPFSGIWKHSLAEHALMKIVSKCYQVTVIRCERTFEEFCTVMNSKGLQLSSSEFEKKNICDGCLENANLLHNPNFDQLLYESVPIQEESQNILSEIQRLDAKSLINLKFMEIDVGKLSAFETIIKFKKTNLEFSENEILHLRTKIKHAVRAILIARETVARNQPKCVFVFNPQYAVGGAFSNYCTNLGIKVYGVNFTFNSSENSRSVLVWNWGRYKLGSPAIESWAMVDRKVTKNDIARAKRHLKTLVKSNSPFVYSTQSSGKSTRETFGIPQSKRILLLAMSSYDEVFANFTAGLTKFSPLDGKVFSDQIEWVLATVEYLKDMDDVAIIIRPHPREIANRRDSVKADHSSKIESVFQSLPSNVYVDWPNLGFSIYDHFKEIHALVTGWSSVGIEAMLSGVPCVSYDSRLVDFPRDIHFTGDNKDAYFQNITNSLMDHNSAFIRSNAVKWYAFAFSRGSIRLNGVLHDQFIFRKFQVTRRLADILEYRFPRIAKRCEIKLGNNLQDEGKLLKLIEMSADNLFEGANKHD